VFTSVKLFSRSLFRKHQQLIDYQAEPICSHFFVVLAYIEFVSFYVAAKNLKLMLGLKS